MLVIHSFFCSVFVFLLSFFFSSFIYLFPPCFCFYSLILSSFLSFHSVIRSLLLSFIISMNAIHLWTFILCAEPLPASSWLCHSNCTNNLSCSHSWYVFLDLFFGAKLADVRHYNVRVNCEAWTGTVHINPAKKDESYILLFDWLKRVTLSPVGYRRKCQILQCSVSQYESPWVSTSPVWAHIIKLTLSSAVGVLNCGVPLCIYCVVILTALQWQRLMTASRHQHLPALRESQCPKGHWLPPFATTIYEESHPIIIIEEKYFKFTFWQLGTTICHSLSNVTYVRLQYY